jgi:hypothetical protein
MHAKRGDNKKDLRAIRIEKQAMMVEKKEERQGLELPQRKLQRT